MRARLMATAVATLICVVPAACSDDSGDNPDPSAAEMVQVDEPKRGAGLVNNVSTGLEASNGSVAASRESREGGAANEEARATVAKMGQPDQPAGW